MKLFRFRFRRNEIACGHRLPPSALRPGRFKPSKHAKARLPKQKRTEK